jgi:hypothetical protein
MSVSKQKVLNETIKWMLLLVFLAGAGLISESIYENFFPSVNQIEMGSKNHFVSVDFYELYKQGKIPKFFFQIKKIKWNYIDQSLKDEIPELSLPFKEKPYGLYNLEVEAFSSSHEKIKIAVLQMSLIEIKSGNKIWELSRSYEIKNEKKPD